jgi:leucyl aminopeptidase
LQPFFFIEYIMFTRQSASDSIAIHLVDEEGCDAWRLTQPEETQAWLVTCLFRAERNRLVLLPRPDGGLRAAVVGIGKRASMETMFWIAAGLPDRLPSGCYRVVTELPPSGATQFAQGWAYGRYRFDRYRKAPSEKSQLLEIDNSTDAEEVMQINAGCSLARDLVNTPASDLSPVHLASAAQAVAQKFGAKSRIYVGDELLANNFPAVHAVGRASHTEPRLIDLEWGNPLHPKVTLVGKGVCFDTGGLDLKPGSSMLLMKKDMGGSASVLGLAHTIMDAGLPVRLRVIIPAVENSVSGNAFRPGDVLQTRRGITVEVGNTDAEGRLVLADALALADAEQPDLLIDLATLTGAARVALGPELPALFTADEKLATDIMHHGASASDPLWQLPLWNGYDDEFSSKIADINNVSSSGFSGAIIGALFLRRFVTQAQSWAHIDMYAWNAKERPGRPVGAEPQCIRALYAYLKARFD